MKYVVDTGALLSLSCSIYFKLLLQEYTFSITPEVQFELEQFSQYDDFLGQKAQEIIKLKLEKITPVTVLSLPLEKAECEVFFVAKEKRSIAITDDVHAARVLFEKTKIKAKPSFYLLLLLYQKKKISKENLIIDIKSVLNYRNWLGGTLEEYASRLIEGLE